MLQKRRCVLIPGYRTKPARIESIAVTDNANIHATGSGPHFCRTDGCRSGVHLVRLMAYKCTTMIISANNLEHSAMREEARSEKSTPLDK